VDTSYPYGKVLQLRLLALLVQKPDKVLEFVEPQFFNHPIYVEIARIAREAYGRYGFKHTRLTLETLKQLVLANLLTPH
jgi:hypothetical protein